MILETLIAATVFITGGSCAGIDNSTNKMVWDSPGSPLVSTTYSDEGTMLLPKAPYPESTDALLALIHAEEALQIGHAGRKVRMQCFKSIDGVPHEIGPNSPLHDH